MTSEEELQARRAGFASRSRSLASIVLFRTRKGVTELDEATNKANRTLEDLENLLQSIKDDSSRVVSSNSSSIRIVWYKYFISFHFNIEL